MDTNLTCRQKSASRQNPQPSLQALRTFEVAARYLNLSKAAREMKVTPGAVSQQIRSLEEQLGVRLFDRINRNIFLTETAQACLPTLRDGFRSIYEALEIIKQQDQQSPLIVSVCPDFASKWLMPRQYLLEKTHPGLDIRIDVMTRPTDFLRRDADVGICYSKGDYDMKIFYSVKLTSEAISPVCSPALLENEKPLATLKDLRHHTLLHNESSTSQAWWPDWASWLNAVDQQITSYINPQQGQRYNQPAQAIQAAVEGRGICLTSTAMVAEDIAAGRLLQPFERLTPEPLSQYFVCSRNALKKPKVQAFHDWLMLTMQSDLLQRSYYN